jgi:D-sedoheptulose 7-phosphate isomerase
MPSTGDKVAEKESSSREQRLQLLGRWLSESAEVKLKIKETLGEAIVEAAEKVAAAIKRGNKILFCGNGGSAADCQHLATEFVVRLKAGDDREPYPAVALTTDTSLLTASANDFGFENIFVRQIEALGKGGDILIAISTSGNSENMVRATESAKKLGIEVVGLLGQSGGKLLRLVDLPLLVPSHEVPRIQEGHITLGHVICELVEKIISET